jgi:dihydroxy-acid dehydratase
MAAASANLPAIQLNGGPRASSRWRGAEVGTGTDLWKYWDEFRAGRITEQEFGELEACLGCSAGACNTMGTASTMTALSEALGMMLPGTSAIPATDARRVAAAEATGRRIVALVNEDLRPSRILTRSAFDNAVRTLLALGGSTNAVIHLIAIAGRRNIDLSLGRFDELAQSTPFLANMSPSGKHLMEAFYAAGGLPALLAEIRDLLVLDCLTVTGRTLGESLEKARSFDRDVIRPRAEPILAGGSLAVVRGNLAPDGAVIKTSAASPALLKHQGKAVVFENYEDMLARINDPDLPVDRKSVLVLKNAGAKGVPGFPEWGMIPLPTKLLQQGVTDMVRISDSRMSGTSYGTVVIHISPEAAAGGLLALVQNGDRIELDVARRRLELLVDSSELDRRRQSWSPPATPHRRGYPRFYIDHVLQAHEGADFDFLRPRSDDDLDFIEPIVGRS